MKAKLALFLLFVPVLGFTQTYTYSTLVNFSNLNGSPQGPNNLIIDSNGILYGTSEYGGTFGFGTVFKVTNGVAKRLYNFKGAPSDGAYPLAALTRDKATGDLYGTTYNGGEGTECYGFPFPGCGTVFKVTSSGKETLLYRFPEGTDGGLPEASVTLDSKGNLYGAVNAPTPVNSALVFKLTAADVFSTVHSFLGFTLASASLIDDRVGNLYGTINGTNAADGEVFKLTPEGQLTTLHTFTGEQDGGSPSSKLTQDAAGNLYGSTVVGGATDNGVVFKISRDGVFSVLYSFCQLPKCADGANPIGWLTLDSAGDLYGMTSSGSEGGGVIFKITPSGAESVLFSPVVGQPSYPEGYGLVMDKAGNLYGSTFTGGTYNLGTIFKLTKN